MRLFEVKLCAKELGLFVLLSREKWAIFSLQNGKQVGTYFWKSRRLYCGGGDGDSIQANWRQALQVASGKRPAVRCSREQLTEPVPA